MRDLVLCFGDQLNVESAAIRSAEPDRDVIWMCEADSEAVGQVWSTKMRIAVFLAAMRHFRDELQNRGFDVCYRELSVEGPALDLFEQLRDDLVVLRPNRVLCVWPGEYRVLQQLKQVCADAELPLVVLEDEHFLISPEDFAEYAGGRKSLRMEYFYRMMRKRFDILLDDHGKPEGGQWNYDQDNRETFGRDGPESFVQQPLAISPDSETRSVLDLVRERFANAPGSLDEADFVWPVTRSQAYEAMEDFVKCRLGLFGSYQDAMWTGEPFLYHSRLSAALNLKLLDPRDVIAAAEKEYREGRAPLNAVEGFIRQILGWREYVRGIYWLKMPGYLRGNALNAREALPAFYWTGDTPLRCLRESIGQTLRFGYAHHIQRLMVTGLYAMLLGVDPQEVHEWYLAVYVDAVEWVELPNVLGMSQYSDGGLLASKPYAATGKYIERMSNYCTHCPMNPRMAEGDKACPFTTLYWDFLLRNESILSQNPRMRLQLQNLNRLSETRKEAIRARAQTVRADPSCGRGEER